MCLFVCREPCVGASPSATAVPETRGFRKAPERVSEGGHRGKRGEVEEEEEGGREIDKKGKGEERKIGCRK